MTHPRELLKNLIESQDPLDAYWQKRQQQIDQKVAGAAAQMQQRMNPPQQGNMVACVLRVGTDIYSALPNEGFGTTMPMVVKVGEFSESDAQKVYYAQQGAINECVFVENQFATIDATKIGEDIPNHRTIRLTKVNQGHMGQSFYVKVSDLRFKQENLTPSGRPSGGHGGLLKG